ncbi:MAG: copper-binding protein, partial [Singulisphaera sp.]
MIPQGSPPVAILRNLALGLALVAGAGCGGKAPRDGVAARVPPAGPSPSTRSYPLVGVVRQVEVKSGVVTIRHEAIPGFMEAMTMPFALKDRGLLDDLRPGDEVAGTLQVVSERGVVKDYDLVDLRV